MKQMIGGDMTNYNDNCRKGLYVGIGFRLLVELVGTAFLTTFFFWTFPFDFMGVIVFSLVLIGMIYSAKHISGGYFNPAFTLAAIICGNKRTLGNSFFERVVSGSLYIVAQFVGAFTSMFLTSLLFQSPAPELPALNVIMNPPNAAVSSVLQFVSMLFMVIVFLSVMGHHQRKNMQSAIIIGLTYMGLGITLGQYDGGIGVLNPAISVTSNIVNAFPIFSPWNPLAFLSGVMFLGVEAAAAFFGGVFYHYFYTYAKPYRKMHHGKRKHGKRKRKKYMEAQIGGKMKDSIEYIGAWGMIGIVVAVICCACVCVPLIGWGIPYLIYYGVP